MKLRQLTLAVSALAVISVSHAQAPVGPFAPAQLENFAAVAPGSYAGFAGFGGTAAFSRLGMGGAMVVSNAANPLPPASQPNAMFGRGVNVAIRWRQHTWRRFGGLFRVPNAGIANNAMQVRFFFNNVQVGAAVNAPINNAAWQWRGWALPTAMPAFNEVRIYGLPSVGYVGMDNLRVAQ